MPWKAFMQSSALTNSDNQLANELFMQSENASCSLNIAPKWGDSLFELFCCHLGEIKTLFAYVLNGCTYVIYTVRCSPFFRFYLSYLYSFFQNHKL